MSGAGGLGSALPTSALPPINQTLEPTWVRHGSPATQKSYQTALAFEEMLVEQLSKSLTATSGLEGESDQEGQSSSEGGSSSSPLSSMLPQALTSGVMSAGGLGLAAQMTRQLEGSAAATQSVAGGGAPAGTTSSASPPGGSRTSSTTGGTGATGGTST
jgi:Rod binding domain-containing protein